MLLQKHGFANVNLRSLHYILSRNNDRSASGKEQVLIKKGAVWMTSRILVVNDPRIDQKTLDDLSSVFDVTVVSDAKKAISLVRTHHDIDLLVFDTDMRHCDPLHFLQELNAG